MMIRAPENKPAAPSPAITRPRISITDDTAVAQIKLPSSNIARKLRNTHFDEKYRYILPDRGCKAQTQMRYALPYHPTSSRELNFVVIVGIA
jgi:hypothetical protein